MFRARRRVRQGHHAIAPTTPLPAITILAFQPSTAVSSIVNVLLSMLSVSDALHVSIVFESPPVAPASELAGVAGLTVKLPRLVLAAVPVGPVAPIVYV